MAKSSKLRLAINVGNNSEDRDRIALKLRAIAAIAVGEGRYGGNISLLLERLADLPEEEAKAIGVVLKKFLDGD